MTLWCTEGATITQKEETYMSLGTHLQELKRKHATLSAKVEESQRSPATDDLTIRALKKEKLRLKEQIERLDA